MSTKVRINFDKKNHSKPYEYDIDYPLNPTKQNIAMAISEAMVKVEISKKKHLRRFNLSRYYNLMLKLLDNHTNIHYASEDKPSDLKSAYREVAIKNNGEKPVFLSNGKVNIQEWRVGYTFNNHIVLDIDNMDKTNMEDIKQYYENVLSCSFEKVITGGGYWLISKKSYEVGEWMYNMCRIFNPELKPNELKEYRNGLLSLDMDSCGKFRASTPGDIKNSKYYHGHGDFCVSFVFMCIKRVKACLRITKKTKDEVIEVIL